MTIAQWLQWARGRLADIDSRAVDADALLSSITGKSSASLLANAAQPLPDEQAENFKSAMRKRARGEPVAYLTGRKEFWSLTLAVTPEVLIPRPETELLVEQVLAHAAHRRRVAVLELGTGSGAIALALASELPHCAMVATDISPAAIEVAKHNRRLASKRRKLAHLEFRIGDWFQAVAAQRFDVIVANPPYIARHDPHLRHGDLRFEPRLALVSPRNGLAALTHIIRNARPYLKDGGILLLEHGYDQAAAVRQIFTQNGFGEIKTHRDLSGYERVTSGLG